MTQVSEIMNPQVISVDPQMTLRAAIELFTQRHIGGAPVVDRDGSLVGMISELQMLDVIFDADVRTARVGDYMLVDVQSVSPHESLAEAGQLFALYSFRRLPVVENGSLVGIITRRDLMNHALRTGEVLTEPLMVFVPELARLT
jgi:CBS domain-containing protein